MNDSNNRDLSQKNNNLNYNRVNSIPDRIDSSNRVVEDSSLTLNSLYGTSTTSNTNENTQVNKESIQPNMIKNEPQQSAVNSSVGINHTSEQGSSSTSQSFTFSSLNHQEQNQVQNSNYQHLFHQNFQSTMQGNDEELLKAFIGNNYESIITKPFNFAAFFFSSLYLFYRKMFGYALVVFVLNFVVLNLIKNFTVTAIFNVIIGLCANKLYIFYARKKIEKIKLENTQKDIAEIKKICSNKGGVSIGLTILGFIIEVVSTIIILVIMLTLGVASIFGNLFLNLGGKNGTYNGVMSLDSSVNMNQEFSITVPSQFKNDSTSSEYQYEYTSSSGGFNKCSISFTSPEDFSNAEDLIRQIAKYETDNNPTTVTKNSINNIEWYWFTLNDSFGKKYYYGTTKNNKVFLLEYEIQEDAPSDCEQYQQQILNSIQAK